MKRKIIKLGQATYVASLPNKWIREHHLDKGDYLEFQEKEGDLIISPEKKGNELKKITLNLQKSNTKLSHAFLETVYNLGYEEIEIIHEPYIEEYKTHKKVDISSHLQQFINNRLIGLEVVEQSQRRTLIKDLGNTKEGSHLQVYNRILFLIKSLAEDCYAALINNNLDLLNSIEIRFTNIRKFILYYERLLSIDEMSKNEFKFKINLGVNLNNLISAYRVIARETLIEENTYSKEALSYFHDVNEHLFLVIQLCLKMDVEKAFSVIQEREKLWNLLHSIKYGNKDYLLFFTFGGILGSTSNLIKDLVGLKLQST